MTASTRYEAGHTAHSVWLKCASDRATTAGLMLTLPSGLRGLVRSRAAFNNTAGGGAGAQRPALFQPLRRQRRQLVLLVGGTPRHAAAAAGSAVRSAVRCAVTSTIVMRRHRPSLAGSVCHMLSADPITSIVHNLPSPEVPDEKLTKCGQVCAEMVAAQSGTGQVSDGRT